MNLLRDLFKKLRLRHIDVYIYKLPEYKLKEYTIDMSLYTVKIEKQKKHSCYCILERSKRVVHKSFIFENVHLLKLIGVHGHVIGGCVTSEKHRGQGLYPFMLNKIGRTYVEARNFDLYIIVDKTNLSSIRGIEKAGYILFKSVKARRLGVFYFDKHIY